MRTDRLDDVCLDVSLSWQWHVVEVRLSSDLAAWPVWKAWLLPSRCGFAAWSPSS